MTSRSALTAMSRATNLDPAHLRLRAAGCAPTRMRLHPLVQNVLLFTVIQTAQENRPRRHSATEEKSTGREGGTKRIGRERRQKNHDCLFMNTPTVSSPWLTYEGLA